MRSLKNFLRSTSGGKHRRLSTASVDHSANHNRGFRPFSSNDIIAGSLIGFPILLTFAAMSVGIGDDNRELSGVNDDDISWPRNDNEF